MFVVRATLLPCLHCIRHALVTTIFIGCLADLFRFPDIETHGFLAVMKRTLHDFLVVGQIGPRSNHRIIMSFLILFDNNMYC